MKYCMIVLFCTTIMLGFEVVVYSQNIKEKKIFGADSSFCVLVFEDTTLIKKYCYDMHGIRNGKSEEWHRRYGEYSHVVMLYNEGVLIEFSILTSDELIIENTKFKNSRIYSQKIIDHRTIFPDSIYHTELVFDYHCGYWRYLLLNNNAIDSTYIEPIIKTQK